MEQNHALSLHGSSTHPWWCTGHCHQYWDFRTQTYNLGLPSSTQPSWTLSSSNKDFGLKTMGSRSGWATECQLAYLMVCNWYVKSNLIVMTYRTTSLFAVLHTAFCCFLWISVLVCERTCTEYIHSLPNMSKSCVPRKDLKETMKN